MGLSERCLISRHRKLRKDVLLADKSWFKMGFMYEPILLVHPWQLLPGISKVQDLYDTLANANIEDKRHESTNPESTAALNF
jgi:hypothetical protein